MHASIKLSLYKNANVLICELFSFVSLEIICILS